MITPQGRLTHQSWAAIPTSVDFNGQALYYAPYLTDQIPMYDGASVNIRSFSQLAHSFDGDATHAGYLQSGHIYDEFVVDVMGTLMLGNGPSWASTTVRGVGAGSSELELFGGVRVNKNPIPVRFSPAASDIVTVPARQATYVGTVYATANGFTKFQMKPPMGPGGSANVLGYWNGYNRETVSAFCQDVSGDWSYGNTAKRFARGSANFRIYWVDGLAQSMVHAEYKSSTSCTGLAPGALTVSPVLDATSPLPVDAFYGMLSQGASNNPTTGMEVTGKDFTPPLLGLHYFQAMEEASPNAVTVYSENWSTLMITLRM